MSAVTIIKIICSCVRISGQGCMDTPVQQCEYNYHHEGYLQLCWNEWTGLDKSSPGRRRTEMCVLYNSNNSFVTQVISCVGVTGLDCTIVRPVLRSEVSRHCTSGHHAPKSPATKTQRKTNKQTNRTTKRKGEKREREGRGVKNNKHAHSSASIVI